MLDKLYQHFVHHHKSKVKDVAIDAARKFLDWMWLLWERQQSRTPQKVYVRIQEGREYQKTSHYRNNPWL